MSRIILALLMTFSWIGLAEAVTLTFKAQYIDREPLDLGSPGSSLGDTVPGNGSLLDLQGNVIGSFEVSATVTHKKADSEVRWVHAEYAFGDGTDSINIEGAEEFLTPTGSPALNRPLHYAVSGGTGRYAGARGECLVKRIADNDFITTCKFRTIRIRF